jgi:hypothetical protein
MIYEGADPGGTPLAGVRRMTLAATWRGASEVEYDVDVEFAADGREKAARVPVPFPAGYDDIPNELRAARLYDGGKVVTRPLYDRGGRK